MIWADIVILVLVGLSMLISLWRGFTREALSLVAWIAAFWVGFTFAVYPAAYLEPHVSVPSARLALGFLGLFLVTLLLGGVVNYLIGKAVDKTGFRERLEAMAISELGDLATTIPNFSIGDGVTTNLITMRGMGSGEDRSFEQSVSMFDLGTSAFTWR